MRRQIHCRRRKRLSLMSDTEETVEEYEEYALIFYTNTPANT